MFGKPKPSWDSRCVVTSGRDPFEVDFARELIAQAPVDFHEIGTLSVNQLGALIENSAGFLGVDSMPMHLASALGKPGVALFGPTDERMWGPWHSRIAVMRERVPLPARRLAHLSHGTVEPLPGRALGCGGAR